MRIYIADISAYANGHPIGIWLDPMIGPEALREQVDQMLEQNPIQPAEEWAVHAYREFPDLGEHPTLEEIVEVAELIEEYGDAAYYFVEWKGHQDNLVEKFTVAYYGEYDSEADFTEGYLDDSGLIEEVPDWIADCIDYKRYWNSVLRYDFYETHGYYFWRNS